MTSKHKVTSLLKNSVLGSKGRGTLKQAVTVAEGGGARAHVPTKDN